MAIDPEDSNIIYMPEDQILAASGPCLALRDRWFVTHPTRGLLFFRSSPKHGISRASPQCHSVEGTARILMDKLYPWATLRFFPLVLKPISLSDYA